jgi:hypothetical protein
MTDRAKYLLWLHYGGGGMSHRYYEEYNVIGDPSVHLYIMRPRTMTVTHPAVVPIGASVMPVSVQADKAPLQDALVCAMKASTKAILATAYTDAGGNASLAINPGGVDTVYVTVTAYNCRPYEGYALARATGVEAGEPAGLPLAFALGAVSPLSGRGLVRYALPRDGHVRLAVYDALGRCVRTLAHGQGAAGWKQVSWDSRGLSAGVYFVRLEAEGSGTATRKVVILR